MAKKYMNSQEAMIRLLHDIEGRAFLIRAGISIFAVTLAYFLLQPFVLSPEEYILDFDKVIIVGTFCLGTAIKFYFGGKEKTESNSKED